MLEIDFEELFRSLNRESTSGLTAYEIRKITGWGEKRTRYFLRDAISAGKCRPIRKVITNVAGVVMPVPAYVFEEE